MIWVAEQPTPDQHFFKEIDMEVVTREEFKVAPSALRKQIEDQLTFADDHSPHDICDDTPSSSWRIVPRKPSALAFGFDMMNASEADDPVVS